MDTKRWFHPNVTPSSARKLLLAKGCEGSFLSYFVPESASYYIISKRGQDIVTLKIKSTEEHYYLHDDTLFSTLWELLQYYFENPGLLQEKDGEVISLKSPLYYDSGVKERWFHGSISGQEAEGLLMVRGCSGSYLMRSSVSSPGDMVLLIRKDNKVTNVKIYNKGPVYDVGGGLQFFCLGDLIEYYKKNPMSEMNGEVIALKEPLFTTKLIASDIKERVEDLSIRTGKDFTTGFTNEFSQLHSYECKVLHSRTEGGKPVNQSKNRYPLILPYDYNRVILDNPASAQQSDYINASYISGLVSGTEKKYIASQGCLVSTVNDFWSMIYEEDVDVIIMATNEFEHDNDKCACYWPKTGCCQVFGKVKVQTMSVSVDKDNCYTLRAFCLSKGNGAMKYLSQYHFTSWPDKGMPEKPMYILNLLKDVRQHYTFIRDTQKKSAPIVIHCNNGIGRTGTLIAIDILIDVIKKIGLECELDVHRTVLHIRNQRFGMVQTEEQYKFIYTAVMQYVLEKKNELVSID